MAPTMILQPIKKTAINKVKEFIAWTREQFIDPTSGMHAMGFGIVGYEVLRSWHSKTPLDMQKIYTAFGLFGGGFVGDKYIPAAQAPKQ